MRSINFIPRATRERAALRRRAVVWACVVSATAVTLTGATLTARSFGGDQRTRLAAEAARVADRTARAEAALRSLRAQVSEASQRLESSKTIGVHPDWSVLMRALAALRGDDLMLISIDVRAKDQQEHAVAPPGGQADKGAADPKAGARARTRRKEAYTLQIRGRALTQMGVLEFVKRVEDLDLMAEVSPPQTRAEPYMGVQGVWFEMECRLTERSMATVSASEDRR
ncbi:MAG: hypothetical protein ACK4WH_10825 [Phycisphaerales bacterium]